MIKLGSKYGVEETVANLLWVARDKELEAMQASEVTGDGAKEEVKAAPLE